MTYFSRIARDACLIVVGIICMIDTPPSVQEAGIYGPLSKVWALMLGLGALASLLGVIRRRPAWEIAGCSFVGGGFAVWALAALLLPHLTPTAVAISLVFLSGTAGQFYRVGVVSQQRRLTGPQR